MSNITMDNLEMLLKRNINDRLEKATAAALTAAYEIRLASYAAQSRRDVDPAVIKNEVMGNYFTFCAELQTSDPRPRRQP
jgi:hypothetical protein